MAAKINEMPGVKVEIQSKEIEGKGEYKISEDENQYIYRDN